MGVNYRDFKPVTSEAVPFVYLASVCWSLQCLISALTHAGGGGLLFRFTCSVLLQGGRGAADRYRWPVWGALAVSGHTGFAPLTGVCFPRLYRSGSGLLCRKRALRCVRFQFSGTPQKRGLSWACVLCLPCPEQLRQPGAWGCTFPGCSAPSPLCNPSLSFPVCQSGVCGLCLFSGAGL